MQHVYLLAKHGVETTEIRREKPFRTSIDFTPDDPTTTRPPRGPRREERGVEGCGAGRGSGMYVKKNFSRKKKKEGGKKERKKKREREREKDRAE